MLEIKNLDVSYGYAKVLHDVSLNIKTGEMVFLIGRNGAGKTTMLKTIAGLLRPQTGSIVFAGKEISNLSPEQLYLQGFRYVGQEKKVFGNLTVQENIELAAFASREPMDVSLKKITSIYPKIKGFLKTKAGQLSGGQRQILLVGRALVGEPKLLLIDEPTQGLAAIVIEEIIHILNGLKERVSALIVEQNLTLVNHLSDRVFLLKEGKMVREIVSKSEACGVQDLEGYL